MRARQCSIYLAFEKYNFESYKIVLLDCNEHEMAHRLIQKRNQPELLNDDFKNWLIFLRNQAKELKAPVIDTSGKSEHEVLNEYEKAVGL